MMKKRSAQLFICALTAGIIATASFTGIATIKGIETTKTVEYAMEENLNGIYYDEPNLSLSTYRAPYITIINDNEYKDITECDSIGEVIRGLPRGLGYKRLYLKGYDGEVLAITDKIEKKDGKNTSYLAFFFTKTHGEHVHYVGTLSTGDKEFPLRIRDGIINSSIEKIFYTYYMNSNGKEFIKDSAMPTSNDNNKGFVHGTYYDNTASNMHHFNDKLPEETKNTPVIDFEIKK